MLLLSMLHDGQQSLGNVSLDGGVRNVQVFGDYGVAVTRAMGEISAAVLS
jgi:hypothetical protein